MHVRTCSPLGPMTPSFSPCCAVPRACTPSAPAPASLAAATRAGMRGRKAGAQCCCWTRSPLPRCVRARPPESEFKETVCLPAHLSASTLHSHMVHRPPDGASFKPARRWPACCLMLHAALYLQAHVRALGCAPPASQRRCLVHSAASGDAYACWMCTAGAASPPPRSLAPGGV